MQHINGFCIGCAISLLIVTIEIIAGPVIQEAMFCFTFITRFIIPSQRNIINMVIYMYIVVVSTKVHIQVAVRSTFKSIMRAECIQMIKSQLDFFLFLGSQVIVIKLRIRSITIQFITNVICHRCIIGPIFLPGICIRRNSDIDTVNRVRRVVGKFMQFAVLHIHIVPIVIGNNTCSFSTCLDNFLTMAIIDKFNHTLDNFSFVCCFTNLHGIVSVIASEINR